MGGSVGFLELLPEFGGKRFGPFEGVEIRIGSEAESNDITVPAKLGVAPRHAKLVRQDDASFVLAPVDRSATIYLYVGNEGDPRQVTGPTALSDGDAFALVTKQGVRFQLRIEKDARAIEQAAAEAEGPKKSGKGRRLWSGIGGEIRRRGFAVVFTTALGNRLQTLWQLVKSGSLFSPTYVVTGMLILSGWMLAGGSCVGAVRTNWRANHVTDELSRCQAKVAQLRAPDGLDDDPSVEAIAGLVLGNKDAWSKTLQNDADLLDAFRAALREVHAQQERYAWTFHDADNAYIDFKQDLELQGLPLDVVRVLAFAAAHPGRRPDWTMLPDSEGHKVCARGPLDLTYRMARAIGLDAKPDALVAQQVARAGDLPAMREQLERTIELSGHPFGIRDDLIVSAPVAKGMSCLYVDGDDERTDAEAIARALVPLIGTGAAGVPPVNDDHWIAARLYVLFAKDFRAGIDGLDGRSAPSVQLGTLQVLDEPRAFAARRVARLMARASVVPCFAQATSGAGEVPPKFLTKPPSLSSCGILRMYIDVNRL